MNKINFNDLPCDIKYLIFKQNRFSAIKEKQQRNKNRLLNHIDMINKIMDNDFAMIENVIRNQDLFEAEYCNEYLLEDELDALQEAQFNNYYN